MFNQLICTYFNELGNIIGECIVYQLVLNVRIKIRKRLFFQMGVKFKLSKQ